MSKGVIAGVSAVGATLVLLVLAAVGVVAGYELRYRDRVYPGTHVLDVDLGGMTRDQAETAIESAFIYPVGTDYTFRDGELVWTATPAQLGVRIDARASADMAMQIGRLGSFTDQLNDQGYALWYRVDLAPVIVFDEGKAQAFLGAIAAQIDRQPQDAVLAVSGTQVQYTPGHGGRTLDVKSTLVQIGPAVAALEPADIALVIRTSEPSLPEASEAQRAAQAVLASPITLVNDSPLPGDPQSSWTLLPDRLAQMLIVKRVDEPGKSYYTVGLDAAQLQAFLAPVEPLFKRETVDARYTFNDETRELDLISPSAPGRALDAAATVAAIQAAAPTANHRVPLAFVVTQPQYGDALKAADLGIQELLTSQATYFAGSSEERVTNIRVAASRFHGVLVAPGEEFSFDKYLGDVSLDTGFAEALIIFNGRTIQGVGGGVCQVSTTLFRASFNAGFPTVERWPHAYRVGWYERGFGPGLDATVFAPEVDFKFKNDSEHYILIESYTNATEGRLTFKIYGTKDRDVTVNAPVIANVIPHPPDKYEENPNLAQGEVKKVDYAVDGADVTVTRVVTRNGQPLFTDSVFTRYVPWQAVYEYGPGTPGMPPP